MKIVFGLFFILYSHVMFSQQNIILKTNHSQIVVKAIEYKTDTLIFINVHNNETTSIKAIQKTLPRYFGKFLAFQSGGTREINLVENRKKISFDPNRIFTKTGIESTLRNYACYSEQNFESVNHFSKQVLQLVKNAKLLVALHNNSNGAFSVTSILKENAQKHDFLEIYINKNKDEEDFYYVTQKSAFDYFKSKNYNVVLQDNINIEDDGSLSVYCGKNSIPYINIECENKHLSEQIAMIEELFAGLYLRKIAD